MMSTSQDGLLRVLPDDLGEPILKIKHRSSEAHQLIHDRRNQGYELAHHHLGGHFFGKEVSFELTTIEEPRITYPDAFFSEAKAESCAQSQDLADGILLNQEAIPKCWKGLQLLFPGTCWLKNRIHTIPNLYWSHRLKEWRIRFRKLESGGSKHDRYLKLVT